MSNKEDPNAGILTFYFLVYLTYFLNRYVAQHYNSNRLQKGSKDRLFKMKLVLRLSTQKSDQELLLDEAWRKGIQFQILNSGKSKVQSYM